MIATTTALGLRIEGLDDYQTRLLETSPEWLKNLRQRAVSQFLTQGMPTVQDEEFKYTSLAELSYKKHYLPSSYAPSKSNTLAQYLDKADINVVLVNGLYESQEPGKTMQTMPGLTIMPLLQAAKEFGKEVEALISKYTANDAKSLLALNQALFLDGVFIRVEDNVQVPDLVHIVHVTDVTQEHAVVFPRVLVHVGEGSSVNILETHMCGEDVPYWSNAVLDMRLGKGASVSYCKAEAEGEKAVLTTNTRIWQETDSKLDIFSFMHRAHLNRHNLSVFLKGESTQTVMNGFYALDAKQHVDNHTLIDIQQPNCTSYQLYKGILNGASRAVFNGKIYVHPIAQKTNGYQLNKHLLLGPEARVDTKPQLEIFADDVKCTHGATIGQINEEEVFYLQSRCIPKEMAVSLLSRGFIDEMINAVKVPSIRTKLNYWLTFKFPKVAL